MMEPYSSMRGILARLVISLVYCFMTVMDGWRIEGGKHSNGVF